MWKGVFDCARRHFCRSQITLVDLADPRQHGQTHRRRCTDNIIRFRSRNRVCPLIIAKAVANEPSQFDTQKYKRQTKIMKSDVPDCHVY
jgi:hypothetical protein